MTELTPEQLSAAVIEFATARDELLLKGYTIEPKADFRGADLSGANFFLADLSGANLTGANLKHVSLNGANVTGANFTGANLKEANLKGAINLAYATYCHTQIDKENYLIMENAFGERGMILYRKKQDLFDIIEE